MAGYTARVRVSDALADRLLFDDGALRQEIEDRLVAALNAEQERITEEMTAEIMNGTGGPPPRGILSSGD